MASTGIKPPLSVYLEDDLGQHQLGTAAKNKHILAVKHYETTDVTVGEFVLMVYKPCNKHTTCVLPDSYYLSFFFVTHLEACHWGIHCSGRREKDFYKDEKHSDCLIYGGQNLITSPIVITTDFAI